VQDQAHDKHHEEQKEADFGDSGRRECDESKSQGSSNQCNQQEQ
jgi:hypothetical protein